MIVNILLVIIAILILYVLFKLLKNLVVLALNSLFALISLFLINMAFGLDVIINLWSILIVAAGGIPGLVLVMILHFTGFMF